LRVPNNFTNVHFGKAPNVATPAPTEAKGSLSVDFGNLRLDWLHWKHRGVHFGPGSEVFTELH